MATPTPEEVTRPSANARLWLHFHQPTDRAHVRADRQPNGRFVLDIDQSDQPTAPGLSIASPGREQIEATLLDALAAIRAVPDEQTEAGS